MDLDEFERGSVPVIVAARVYGKDAAWVNSVYQVLETLGSVKNH